MDVSVIIPAYNEELFIASTLESIKRWMPANIRYEVILIDHGSTDKTVIVARQQGAIILDGKDEQTIAALRNIGASHAQGEVLFFIDADVIFSEKWSRNISSVLDAIKEEPNKICGAHPVSPEGTNVLIKSWFDPKAAETSPNYIAASHLILAKETFKKVGGFSGSLETSEEVDLCRKARNYGVVVQAYPELLAIHMGTPQTLDVFVKSEIWHGRGDWSSLSSLLSSRAALLTLGFIFFHGILVFSFLSGFFISPFVAVIAIVMICIVASFFKFSRHGFYYSIINIPTFYLYFLARGFSFFDFFINKKIKKRNRDI